jgi:hypothetical protein
MIISGASFFIVYVFLIAIGLLLIISVIKIHRFMKKVPETQRISVKALLIHAGAFGLFLISDVMTCTAMVLFLLNTSSPQIKQILNLTNILYSVLSFISQCCIVHIFWQLAHKPSEDVYVEVHEVSFDEDAKLQAMIWNQFVRVAVASTDQPHNSGSPAYSDEVMDEQESTKNEQLQIMIRSSLINE